MVPERQRIFGTMAWNWIHFLIFILILAGNIGYGLSLLTNQESLSIGSEGDHGRIAYCIGVTGTSPGVHHFAKDFNAIHTTGIGMYMTSVTSVWRNFFPAPFLDPHKKYQGPGYESISKTFTNISVTGIEVGGRRLEGWFHIKLSFPNTYRYRMETDPVETVVYAFVIQIEDATGHRASGEFTTDLLHQCLDKGVPINVNSIPTEYQILPCHSIAESQASLSNAVAYWREADLPDDGNETNFKHGGIIRTRDVTELRVNWKLPNNFGGGFSRRFFIRADILTVNATRSKNYYANANGCYYYATCRYKDPYGHTSLFTEIHLPSMTDNFYGPDGTPIFDSASTKVNCDVFIKNFSKLEDAPKAIAEPFFTQHPIERKECQEGLCFEGSSASIRGGCGRLPDQIVYGPSYTAIPSEKKVNLSLPISCRPKGADFNAGACTLGSIYTKDPPADFELKYPLFLGRCKEDHRPYGSYNGSDYWRKPGESDHYNKNPVYPRVGTQSQFTYYRLNYMSPKYTIKIRHNGSGSPEDDKFVDELPTAEEYLNAMRYDTCNCYPPVIPATGGEIKLGPIATPGPTPPPDYPVLEVRSAFRNAETGEEAEPTAGKTKKKVESVEDQVLEKIRISHSIHAVFMTIAFMFMVPVGIFIVRYLKETFHGMTLLIYDLWYTLHVFSVMGTVAVLFWGEVGGVSAKVWGESVMGIPKSTSHEVIGWVVLVIYVVLVCTGGIRNYGATSDRSLMCSIHFHSILGYVFYWSGLAAMLVYCIEMRVYEPLGVLGAWIVIDIGFHLGMTLLAKMMDRKFDNLNRVVFPTMELLISDRNAPGRGIRLIAFAIYVTTSVIFTFAFCSLIVTAEYSGNVTLTFNYNLERKKFH